MFFLPHKSSALLRNTKTFRSTPLQRNGIPLGPEETVQPTVRFAPFALTFTLSRSPDVSEDVSARAMGGRGGGEGSLLRNNARSRDQRGSMRVDIAVNPDSDTTDRAKSGDRNEGAGIDC